MLLLLREQEKKTNKRTNIEHSSLDRYETKSKSHKSNHNHQGYRGKKNDNNSGSTEDKYSHARSNRSNEKISSSEALAKEIEQASTIRPQGKQRNCPSINHQLLHYAKSIDYQQSKAISFTALE